MTRSRVRRAAALAVLALAASGCATPRTTRTPGPSDEGRAFVLRACAGCHAVGPSGESANRDAPPFRELARSRSDAQLLGALQAISKNGHVEMPPIYVTPDEMAEVVAYLGSLRGRGA